MLGSPHQAPCPASGRAAPACASGAPPAHAQQQQHRISRKQCCWCQEASAWRYAAEQRCAVEQLHCTKLGRGTPGSAHHPHQGAPASNNNMHAGVRQVGLLSGVLLVSAAMCATPLLPGRSQRAHGCNLLAAQSMLSRPCGVANTVGATDKFASSSDARTLAARGTHRFGTLVLLLVLAADSRLHVKLDTVLAILEGVDVLLDRRMQDSRTGVGHTCVCACAMQTAAASSSQASLADPAVHVCWPSHTVCSQLRMCAWAVA